MRLLLLVVLAAAAAVRSEAARAGGGPKLRNYASAADALASARQLQQTDRKVLFAQWRAENGGKAYASQLREAAAFAAFNAAVDDVIAHNSRAGVRYFKGLTSTADLTFDQFKAVRLMQPVSVAALAPKGPAAAAAAASRRPPVPRRKLQQAPPAALDWRAQGKVSPIRDQGNCGSCWAFAAMATLESRALIDGTPSSGNLSEQQMVDCVTAAAGYNSRGCNGGQSYEALEYVQKFRATTEADYPYKAVDGACLEGSSSAVSAGSITGSGYNFVYAPTRDQMQAAVAAGGPIVIYFRVENPFYRYAGGIYPANSCSGLDINHAMVVVGYNFTGPTPYWIVRNSWGTTWGDAGYAYIEATDGIVDWGTCTIYLLIIQPLATSACAVEHCTTYAANKCTCTVCEAGFQAVNGTCVEMNCAVDRCTAYAANTCNCAGCDAGFKVDGGSCVACNGSEVANCATPNAANKCLCDACSQDFRLSYEKNNCTSCETVSNCATMNDDSCQGCDTCAAGYSRIVNGTFGLCSKCAVAHCATYATNTCTCTACDAGFKLNGASCVACDGSEVANCATANAANKCLCDACDQDYQPSGDKRSCSLCESVSNCATMNIDSCRGCDTCAAGYSCSSDGKACSQCAVKNCATYSTNTCTCTACVAGFKLDGASCVACNVANCATPNASNACLCDACNENYQLSGDKKSCSPVPNPTPILVPAPRWQERRPFRPVTVDAPRRAQHRACRAQYKSTCF